MKQSVIVTSLNTAVERNRLSYYHFSDGINNLYCDALSAAEAGTKYLLSKYRIDSILSFGSESAFNSADDTGIMKLRDGKAFYATDNCELSKYSLYRYRLAEYLDEIDAELQDDRELLDEEVCKKAEKFIRNYFNEKVSAGGSHKFNRFFDRLSNDKELRMDFENELIKASSAMGADPDSLLRWSKNYLYSELRDANKLHLPESNENVTISFISSGPDDDSGKSFTDLLIANIDKIYGISEEQNVEVDVYLCMQNDNAKDSFVFSSLMEAVRSMPDSQVNIVKIIMADAPSERLSCSISDDTEKLGVYELMSATRAFLKYGKTDMLMDFRLSSGIKNNNVDRMLYAMRNIDTGISLCDISDIERGIESLRDFFADGCYIEGDSFTEKYFNVIAKGIMHDYGTLISGESVEFIDLVKWAYRKGFWQQTLTLIESRAPRDFVEKGIYYYCDSPESKEDVIKKFGRIYYDLKPFEKYKLDDVEHYYVKFYSRWRSPHPKDNREFQLAYAKIRVKELDTEDDSLIRAHTLSPDREALENLLFAYYYLGDVRNATNHAADEFSGFASIMDDSDVSERMTMISQAVEYFIHCYEEMTKLLAGRDKEDDKEVIMISPSEISDYANVLRKAARDEHRK